MATPWIITPRPNPAAPLRLVCVPYAGGTVATFRTWGERLTAAEVAVVQLPGRASRLREPMLTSLTDAADGLVDALAEAPARPTVLFGHSLGALIAFETARRLEARAWPALALFVSGRRPPSAGAALPRICDLPFDEFVAEVQRRYDAIPPIVRADPDLMQLLVPGLRADFAMLDNYQYVPAAPLRMGIVACCGAADPHAAPADMDTWRRETTGRFSLHTFAGGHFYLQAEQDALVRLIANQLTVLMSALARSAPTER